MSTFTIILNGRPINLDNKPMKDLGILPIANQNKPNPAEAPTEPETSGSNAVLVAAAAAVAVFFVTKKKKS